MSETYFLGQDQKILWLQGLWIPPTCSLRPRNRKNEKKMLPTFVPLPAEVQWGGEESSKEEREGADYLKCASHSSVALVILNLAQPTFRPPASCPLLSPPHQTAHTWVISQPGSVCTRWQIRPVVHALWAACSLLGDLWVSLEGSCLHPGLHSRAPIKPSRMGISLVRCCGD